MSRASIVALLVALEVLIAGAAAYAIGAGWHSNNWPGSSFAWHGDFAAKPIAPVEVGQTPHVVIDVADSRVEVRPSTDRRVHVTDLTHAAGAFFGGALAQLQVSRTGDGVRIERPSSGTTFDVIGFDDQRIDVDVPPGARVEIVRCGGADVTGVTGGVSVRSQDGHITLADLGGTVEARSDDGYIEATRINGDALTMQTSDGHLALQSVAVATLTAHSDDGHIRAHGVNVSREGAISTNDGSIELGLTPGLNATVDASTSDGNVEVDGSRVARDDGDSARQTMRLGTGAGNLHVRSEDGSIHITTNGAV